jgi:hypothetical protein
MQERLILALQRRLRLSLERDIEDDTMYPA